jgi:hypothetical protein
MFQYAKQPLPITQIWQDGFSLYKATFTKIWYWTFILGLVPLAMIPLAVLLCGKVPLLHHPLMFMIRGIITAIIFALLWSYFYLIPLNRVHQLSTNPVEPVKSAWKTVHQKYWTCISNALYGALLFAVLLIILCLIFTLATKSGVKPVRLTIATLIAIPVLSIGVTLGYAFMFNWPLILFENYNAWAAMKAGIKLMLGQYWRASLGIYLPLMIIYIPMAIIDIFMVFKPHVIPLVFTAVLISIVIDALLLMPLFVSLMLVQFNDLKLRKKNALPVGS